MHPGLELWFLCISMDLTPDEKLWVNTELINEIPKGGKTKIVIWDESFLHGKINEPLFNGLKQSFFNELELSTEWFKNTFNKTFSIVKNKFDAILYVPNEHFEVYYVNPILCNEKFIEQRISYYPRKLEELWIEAKKKLKRLEYTTELWRPVFNQYIQGYSKFNKAFEELLPKLKKRLNNITPNNFEKLIGDDYEQEILFFNNIKHELDSLKPNWPTGEGLERSGLEKQSDDEQYRKIWDLESTHKQILEELKYYVSHSNMPITWRLAHYHGNGGDGKTNFSVGLAKEFIDKGFPAIYIPAILFTGDNPLSDQILNILDIKSGYSFGDFLDCVDTLGRIYDKRIPIILDGLNESVNVNGFLNDRLSLDLPQIETDILERKNLVLLTTCRASYREAIWENVNQSDKRFHPIYGFTNLEDKKKLTRNYFKHYKIQADLSFLSLERFTKPLYLKIFCESINSERKNIKQVTLGFDSIYSIFENFVARCNDNIFKRIKKEGKIAPTPATRNLASHALERIAKELWEEHKRAFLLDDLIAFIDEGSRTDYKYSITKKLLDEELLFIRNWYNGGEHVYLTYDLMAGYFIAKYLIDNVTDFEIFFESEQIRVLIGDDGTKLHPNHEDIVDGLCSLLPIKKRQFVHEIIGKPKKGDSNIKQRLYNKSIAATILLSPEFILEKQVRYLRGLSKHPKNLTRLITLSEDVMFVVDHPFNFSFWSLRLAELTMQDRDITWTEYLRNLREDFLEDLFAEFDILQTNSVLTEEQNAKIFLAADFLKWTFTSTSKSLKGKSANALYRFALKFPALFLKDFYASAALNDPTIFEWMCLVLNTASIVLLKERENKYENEFLDLSKFLSDEVFNPKGTHSTNHLITRNYAYGTLKLLCRKFSKLAQVVDLIAIRKNFSKIGIIQWEQAVDVNAGQYRDGNSLIGYYFDKEKMSHIARGKGHQYNKTPEYLAIQANLRWRAYQLGYKFELFGKIDIEIVSYQHWGENHASTERYADKYIDIAFYEFCGYLDGQDEFDSYDEIGFLHAFEPKHDPTAKTTVDDHSLRSDRFPVRQFIDTKISLSAWCGDHSNPDVSDYLERKDFQQKRGEWVLLYGLVHQHNKAKERQFFFQADTVLVRNKDLKTVRTAFLADSQLAHGGRNLPHTDKLHEAEIPDGERVPHNEFVKWYYSASSKIEDKEYIKIVLVQNGKRLSEKKADKIWIEVLEEANYVAPSRMSLANGLMPIIKYSSSSDSSLAENFEDIFRSRNIELVEEKFTEKETVYTEATIDVLIPLHRHKQKIYLCKNLIDELGLSTGPDSKDLYDSHGELASFNYNYEVEYVDQEEFTYLRKDLLDKYLNKNELTMFQLVWGERDYYPIDGNWDLERKRSIRNKEPFSHAYEYVPKSRKK
ncbi:hypothetical protein OQX64_03750 [Pedobacter sp. GR22-10]|nr:hypothetical protein [Pedobacter sp. GR22-10]